MHCKTDPSVADSTVTCAYHLSDARVELHRLHIRDLMNNKALRADEIYILADSLAIDAASATIADRDSHTAPLPIYVGAMQIVSHHMSYAGPSGNNRWMVDSTDISLQDLVVDDTVRALELETLDIARVDLRSRYTQITLSDITAHEDIRMGSFSASQRDKLNVGEPRAVFSSSLSDISLVGLDIEKLLVDGHIDLDSVIVREGALIVQEYMDHPRCASEPCRAKRFLHEKLAQLEQPISIAYLGLQGVDIRYEQWNADEVIMGLDFDPTYASAYEIGNRPGQSWNLDIISTIFDETEVDLKLKFSPSAYSYDGFIGAYSLSELNGLFLSEGKIEIAEGRASKTYYTVRNDAATGISETTTRFYYDGLKLASNRKKGKFLGKLEEGLANLIIQDDSNPDAISELSIARDSTRGFFYHMVDGLKRGITSELIPGAG